MSASFSLASARIVNPIHPLPCSFTVYQAKFHVPGGLHDRLTRVEIEASRCTAWFPRAVEGMRAARQAFAKLDRAS